MNLKHQLNALALVLFFSLGSTQVLAAEISVETDPATFAFDGYAAHLRIQPDGSPWVFSLGAYSLKFPTVMRSLVVESSSENIDLQLTSGVGVFLDRHWTSAKNEGFFTGVQVAHHNLTLKDKNSPGSESKYKTVIVMPRVGYRWNIGSSGFYLLPWAGLGFVSTIGDDPKIGNQTYSAKKILPFGTLHLGYQF